jgi:coproporphyrinogen III oxidase-like Fe-S oxidoreductase
MPPSTRDAGLVHPGRVEHPSAYADRLGAGDSPAYAREILDEETRRVERVLLEIRLRDGLPPEALDDAGRAAVRDGLLTHQADDRLVLTRRGRLLADAVVRDLLP